VGGCFEQGNQPSGLVKDTKFIGQQSGYQLFLKDSAEWN
jgi:hypothetical protein